MTMTMQEIQRARDADDGGTWVETLPDNAGKRGGNKSKWEDVIELCRANPDKWRHYLVQGNVPKRIRAKDYDDIVVVTANGRMNSDPAIPHKHVCDMYLMAVSDPDRFDT